MRNHKLISTLAAAGLLASAAGALGADAGAVTFATGRVAAEREPAVVLAKGDAVLDADVIVTGDASRAQLSMIDDAKIAIRPNSRLAIAEYVYAGAPAAAGSAVVSSDDNSSVLNLVKGGFRTITGAIASEDAADYEVRTAVGVLGVRGTDFAVLLCSGDCNTAPGVTPGTVVPDGLYLMVSVGSIAFSNELATLVLSAGEFAYIPFDTRLPERLDAPPPVFVDVSDFRFDAAPAGFDAVLGTRRAPEAGAAGTAAPSSAGQEDEQRDTPAQSIRGTDLDGSDVDLTPGGPPDPQNRTIGYATGPIGAQGTQFGGVRDNAPGEYQLDASNDVSRFSNDYPGRTGVDIASFDIGSASTVESGFDTTTVLRWGRWSGGTASVTLSDGTVDNLDLGQQSLHWISSPQWATAPVMPITGVASYSLVGATSPTDNLGNVGVLGNATFVADFTNLSVLSTLDLTIGGSNWLASGQGGIGTAANPVLPAHLFNGIYDAIAIDGVTGGFGQFSGFFSEPGTTSDPSYPGGVGLTFTLQDMAGTTTVSGAAAFGNP